MSRYPDIAMKPTADLPTHAVENQPPEEGDRDLWRSDPVLRTHAPGLVTYAARLGTAEMRQAGRDAERHAPELILFDRAGRRTDEVAFHPAYHRLLQTGFRRDTPQAPGPAAVTSTMPRWSTCTARSNQAPAVP